MNMMNKAFVCGYLGADPVVRSTQNGVSVCSMRVATSSSFKEKGGDVQTRTQWHPVVVFGKLADICNEHLKKGNQVLVEGSLNTRSWDDKDGNKRYITEIQVTSRSGSVQFLGHKNGNGSGKTASAPPSDDKYIPPFPTADDSDDVPF